MLWYYYYHPSPSRRCTALQENAEPYNMVSPHHRSLSNQFKLREHPFNLEPSVIKLKCYCTNLDSRLLPFHHCQIRDALIFALFLLSVCECRYSQQLTASILLIHVELFSTNSRVKISYPLPTASQSSIKGGGRITH